jgi:uncharacterized membrane protein YeaQ/YmgE (transglycosylase-associated protein family)
MLGFIVVMLIIGLVAGFVARAVVPGNDSMGIIPTIILGIVGSFVGGLLADILFRSDAEDVGLAPSGLLGAIVGAIVVLLILNAVSPRRRMSPFHRRRGLLR